MLTPPPSSPSPRPLSSAAASSTARPPSVCPPRSCPPHASSSPPPPPPYPHQCRRRRPLSLPPSSLFYCADRAGQSADALTLLLTTTVAGASGTGTTALSHRLTVATASSSPGSGRSGRLRCLTARYLFATLRASNGWCGVEHSMFGVCVCVCHNRWMVRSPCARAEEDLLGDCRGMSKKERV